jgi:hypothetical protein
MGGGPGGATILMVMMDVFEITLIDCLVWLACMVLYTYVLCWPGILTEGDGSVQLTSYLR